MKDLNKERLLELLADQTLFGLNAEELVELKQLKEKFPHWEENISLELAAAAINLSKINATEEMPANLRTKIFADADDFFNPKKDSTEAFNLTMQTIRKTDSSAIENVVTEPKAPFWQWLGWVVAAAACVALAITLWTTRSQKQAEVVENPNPKVIQTAPDDSSAAKQREQLIASATDVVLISLANPKNEKEVLGDVVWSNAQQKGYARLRGLPANDVAKESYQLWIVDETQDAKTPVSGGVFNITETGEVIVPINAQIEVKKPKAVAVSKEKPGGVVVSKPERLVAIAKV